MPDFDLRVFVPKEGIADPKRLIKVLENSLDTAAEAVKMEFQRTTGSWNHKPAFLIDKRPGSRIIYTTDVIYSYVSGGTRPHPIPKVPGKRRLAFYKTGFRAKSRPDSLTANKGSVATKDFRMPYQVHHPGTKARNFDTTIQKRWRKYLPDQLQRAIDSEFR